MARKKKLSIGKNRSRHHRVPRVHGGTDCIHNVSIVSKKQHMAYNLLFTGHATPQGVANILNEIWIDPAYQLIVEKRQPTLEW